MTDDTPCFVCDANYIPMQVGDLVAERDAFRASLNAAEELICDLAEGAAQASQGHADVLAKVEAYYGTVTDALPPLTPAEQERVRALADTVIARIREER